VVLVGASIGKAWDLPALPERMNDRTCSFEYDLLKCRNPLRNGNPFRHWRNRTLLAYNDRLKSFCALQGLSCLDLESVVRVGDRTRRLDGNLA
jgi:hypothetical protein